ncbi:hypothetical protein HMSSN036_32600 [Paenibacillus macerans]|nr:hypothetical protein HMSSN036_32600 [Paenibacillus macerans]
MDIVVKMLPDLAGQIASPLSSIDKLTVVDTGKGEGAARVSNYVTELMATAPDMLKSVSGIELDRLIQGLTKGKAVASRSRRRDARSFGTKRRGRPGGGCTGKRGFAGS